MDIDTEDTLKDILWKILEEKYESHELIKEEFLSEEYILEDIVKFRFNEFTNIFHSDEIIGYVFGWIDQAVLEIVLEDFLGGIINKFIKYQPDQNGDSGIIVHYKESFYTFELSRESNSITINKYSI